MDAVEREKERASLNLASDIYRGKNEYSDLYDPHTHTHIYILVVSAFFFLRVIHVE